MASRVVDILQNHLDEPIGVISADELDDAHRDPEVIAALEEADRFVAELERQGRSR